MIYFEDTLNLEPASPTTMDKLVDYAQEEIVPACADAGVRILAAWYSHTEWFGQVRHVYEFEDFASFGKHWDRLKNDSRWIEIEKKLDEMAPQRKFNLLEDLNGIPAAVTQKAIEDSAENPLGKYSLAILHVVPGMLEQFRVSLAQSDGAFPIVASWTPVTGNKNVFIDVWKGAIAQEAYAPANEEMKAFFENLRPTAPREKVINVFTLPYSTLK
ncbi:MAG: NIPSNAP family protein [Desulfobacterales bacterium]